MLSILLITLPAVFFLHTKASASPTERVHDLAWRPVVELGPTGNSHFCECIIISLPPFSSSLPLSTLTYVFLKITQKPTFIYASATLL